MRKLNTTDGPGLEDLLFESLPLKKAINDIAIASNMANVIELVRPRDTAVFFTTDSGEKVGGFVWHVGVNYCTEKDQYALILGPRGPSLFRSPDPAQQLWYMGNYNPKTKIGKFTELHESDFEDNPIFKSLLFGSNIPIPEPSN